MASRLRKEATGVNSRCGRADVGELPLEVLLQRLKALKGDLELVGRVERSRVVPDGDVEQAHCRWRSAYSTRELSQTSAGGDGIPVAMVCDGLEVCSLMSGVVLLCYFGCFL